MTCTRPFAFLLVVGLPTLLVACSSGDRGVFGRQRASGAVAVVLQAPTTPVGRELRSGMEAAAKEHGLTLRVEGSGGDPARERQLVDRFVSEKAAAVIVEGVDSTQVGAEARAASAAKVPFFAIGLPAAGAQVVAHVDADHYGAGRVAAEYLAGFLGEKGAVAIVRSAGAHGAREIEQGFRDGIAAHRAMAVVAAVEASDREGSAVAVTAMLRAQRPVRGLFAASPALALGATDGAQAARRSDVAVVAFGMDDLVRAAVSNAQEAPLKAMVIGRAREMGSRVIDEVALRLADEAVAARVRVPVRLVTADSTR